MLDTNIKTTWHVSANTQVEPSDDRLMSHQGHKLMAGAATRVWEELYVRKKPAIEEVFKIILPAPIGNERAPDLSIVREQIHESATRFWLNYVVLERKASYRVPWELHNQIQSVRSLFFLFCIYKSRNNSNIFMNAARSYFLENTKGYWRFNETSKPHESEKGRIDSRETATSS